MSSPDEHALRIRLANDDHAIEAVAIGVDWAPQLEAAALTAANQVHAKLLELLPQKKSIQGVAFKLDAATKAIQLGISGDLVDLIHLDERGQPDFTVSLRPDFFSCSTPVYPGWRTTKPLLLDRLLPFVRAALEKQATMQAIGLQYTDAFRWSKTLGNLLSDVFRRDTPFLPAAVFERKSFWHVHQGWFSMGHRSLRVLNVVNVDYVEEGENHVLRINGQHKLQANSLDGGIAQLSIDDAVDALDGLHEINKEVLHSSLTSTMLRRIGMKTSQGSKS